MSNCENCKLRAKYDDKPKSLLGRFWKWHTKWCPGWNGYLKSLPEKQRQTLQERYK